MVETEIKSNKGFWSHGQKILVPIDRFCPLEGEGISPESNNVALGTKYLIRKVAI